VMLAATDPANPYGAALGWPPRSERPRGAPSRSAGAYVVLHDGELVLYLERGGKSLHTFPPLDDPQVATAAVEALRQLVGRGRLKRLQIERVDGHPVAESGLRERLVGLGFRQAYRGYVLGPA
jgi:ATP-dependent Lhr-like helicase